MSASYNRVILAGNLTRDIDFKYTPSGTAVAETGLAVNTKRAKGEDETCFVDLTLWARSAEVCNEYCSKGSPILVEGRLQYDQWTSADGSKRSKLKVVGERIQLLGSRDRPNNSSEFSSSEPVPAAAATTEEEVPF